MPMVFLGGGKISLDETVSVEAKYERQSRQERKFRGQVYTLCCFQSLFKVKIVFSCISWYVIFRKCLETYQFSVTITMYDDSNL